MIELSRVSFNYKTGRGESIPALNNVNCKLEDGEFLAVLGSNGSGKSTLAKHLNGLLVPDEGRVIVDGRETTDRDHLWEIRRSVGLLFSNPDSQLVSALLEEEVAFGPENLGLPREEIKRRVTEALQQVGLEGYLDHDSHSLSGGQKQFLAIAGILAMEPRYLVLDEPTSMLDPRGAREILALISRISRERGVGILYITHRAEEVVDADRIILLSQGQIVLEGVPEEFFRASETLEQAGIAVPPVTQLAERLVNAGLTLKLPQLSVEGMIQCLLY